MRGEKERRRNTEGGEEKKKTDTNPPPTQKKKKGGGKEIQNKDMGRINTMHKILDKEESEKWRERKVTF